MLGGKIAISGPIARIEHDRIIVRRGEVVESYNPNYYRVLSEVVGNGQIQRLPDQEREATAGCS